MKAVIAAFVAGLVFAIGLGLGGMTDPAKVQGFLDVTGAWDPSLAFVMGGALGTHALLRRLVLRRQRPVLAPAFPATPHARLDRSLLLGSAIFGVGWGLAGFCPGPAVVAVASGSTTALTFAISMMGGMALFRAVELGRAKATGLPRRAPEVSAPAES